MTPEQVQYHVRQWLAATLSARLETDQRQLSVGEFAAHRASRDRVGRQDAAALGLEIDAEGQMDALAKACRDRDWTPGRPSGSYSAQLVFRSRGGALRSQRTRPNSRASARFNVRLAEKARSCSGS